MCTQTAHGIYASEEPQGLALWKRTSTRTTRDPAGLDEPYTLDWTLQWRSDDQQPQYTRPRITYLYDAGQSIWNSSDRDLNGPLSQEPRELR